MVTKFTCTSWLRRRLLSRPSHFDLIPQRMPLKNASRRWFRSASSLGMGCDWYDFKAICSSDYAIMVTHKDIKEPNRPGSTKEDVKEKIHSSIGEDDEDEDEDADEDEDETEDLLDAPLDKEDVEWLLDCAPEYNANQIGESFVLLTKSQNDIREAPCLDVPGPYEIEDEYNLIRFHIEEAPQGKDYTELFELAGKFTPSGSKLSFPPGKYSFATTNSYMMKVKQLKRWSKFNAAVPFDFELIVGNGDQKKTIKVNRAIFLCCFPHIETRFGDALTDTKLELPKLDPQAVMSVLGAFSSRHQVRMPYWEREEGAFYKVQCAFGESMIEISKACSPRLEHPAMADPRWLDASFLCGPHREEIKVNRAVLASMNPVLHRVLFGTDLIPVDPSKPIEWPDFDAQAVRQVFWALLHCGKRKIEVPTESVESTKMLVDYLVETREDLMLIYNTDLDAPTAVPFDFELVVGNGDKMKTIGVNRALLLCCFPHVETRFGDALTDTYLEFPELDPQAVENVLGAFSSRHQVRMPYWPREHETFEDAKRAFGKSMIEIANEEPPTDRPRLEHPAIADPRWLDASFFCGPQREEIKVNCAVLASMNPVLHRVLFGTDLIPVDPSKPIEWPDYDAQAVRQVFLALLHCGKKEFVVPMESVESAKMLVDYLVETREALKLYYDTPFKREYQGRYTLRRGKEQGLLFSYD